jgi:hypothetical protein
MKYTTDGKYQVKAGKTVIAKSFVGNIGYEVRILQGMNRGETIKKICADCPDFATNNNITESYYPKLFS